MFTYQRIIREQKNSTEIIYSEFEKAKDQIDAEVKKRLKIEKRVRKFARWLHKDQRIYIENLVSKLGIEDKKGKKNKSNHKRISSMYSRGSQERS